VSVGDLPAVNAVLNLTSACLVVSGVYFIRRHQTEVHRTLMIAALVASTLFLISYLYYHAQVGSVAYQGQGAIRFLYFAILLSHTVLAAVIVPMVLRTVYLAGRGRLDAHRRIARWTFPIWIYVSVTGVVVYVMLYRF